MTDRGRYVVGADACPYGWCGTRIDGDEVTIELFQTFENLQDSFSEARRILVDIPVGLSDTSRRRCDEKSRGLLGCRGNSVFFSPSSQAVKCDEYDRANETHRKSVGYGLSQQAFHIREKILEVQETVGDIYDGIVRESHPELCFAALNGQPIAYPKSSPEGRALRLQLLEREIRDAESMYRDVREKFPLKEVRRDDILDSIVLAVAATSDKLTTVPEKPDPDEPRMYFPHFDVPSGPDL